MVKIRYIGGRAWFQVAFNRKKYYFTKENNRTLEIKDQATVNHIFSLGNRTQFEVVVEEPNQENQSKEEIAPEKTVIKKSRKAKK